MKKISTALQIVFSQSFYRRVAIISSLIVAYLSYWLINQTTSIPMFLQMTQTGQFGKYSLLYGITYIVTTLLIIGLSGVSVAVMLWLFKHSKLSKGKTLGANLGGFAAAMVGMGCPVCGAFLLSLIGIAGGLTVFPLQGLELKFLSLGLLTASTLYGTSKITATDCEACQDITGRGLRVAKTLIILPLEKLFVYALIILFLINQFFMTQIAATSGLPTGNVAKLFGIKTASGAVIIAPKLNPDGKTTSLVEQPTISEVSANPNTGDVLADAKVVMLATGKPFYAPEDIAYDDPINAQKKWGSFVGSISLSGEPDFRYQKLTSSMVCSYCCGGPTSVTTINRCGCAHARAVQGFFKYMLQNYGDKYSDDQLLGEAHRWYAIWYPKGMLEDYLLATGKGEALPHQTHGGAGTDGRHGL